MKAIFKKTAVDRIYEIISNASRYNKKIDYILVTPEEFLELRMDYRVFSPTSRFSNHSDSEVEFRCVDLENKERPGCSGRYRFPIEPMQFNGFDIVVAPKEFH